MIAFAYYLLKVIICSGILYGYYLLALRNRIFHYWNRYYLLAVIILSLVLPMISIPIVQEVRQTPNEAVKILEIVTTGDAYVQDLNNGPALQITTGQYLALAYLSISLFLLFVMIRTLLRIRQMIRHHKIQTIEDFFFINTVEKGTPFSFLRYIFWHEDIQPESVAGQHILKHEIAHVREKHTHDKLFLNLVLVVYWCNPFFWLIRREMAMIHEFIADKQSVDQQDTAAFAAMILQAAYPRHQFALTNNFFHSPIKRRLKMLIKSQNSRVTYITRLLALPLILLVVAAFTLKPSRINENPSVFSPAIEKSWTFIIDAGHGGEDLGVHSNDGLKEKNLTLAIAKKIKEYNTNPAFNIILSRENDILQPVKEKVDFAVSQHADAFISIHINGAETKQSNGIEVYLGTRNSSIQKESLLLGSMINQEMAKVYQTLDTLKKRSAGIWVLDAPQINYPAAIVECGYLTNPKDRAFITDPKNQEKIAKNILAALERYSSLSNITTKPALKDTLPPGIKSVDITEDGSVIVIDSKGKAEKITKEEAYKRNLIPLAKLENLSSTKSVLVKGNINLNGTSLEPLYVLDGVTINTTSNKDALDLLVKPDDIESVNVLKGESAMSIYGEKGKNGVVIITTKTGTKPDFPGAKVELKEFRVEDDGPAFTEVEIAPKFPNGEVAMNDYIKKQVAANAPFAEDKKDYSGSCAIRFIVDKYGKLSNFGIVNSKATTNSKLASLVIEILQKGPAWNPALQNGNKVRAFHEIVFKN